MATSVNSAKWRIIAWAAAVLLAAVFVYAGIVKALAPAEFAVAIAHYRLVPPWASRFMALYLPWLEVVAGLALLWPPLRRGAGLVLGALLLVFLAAIVQAWARGLDVRCGCFGRSLEESSYTLIVLRDLGLLCLVVVTAVLPSGVRGHGRAA